MSIFGSLHSRFVFPRRVNSLAYSLKNAIGAGSYSILDIGCGDGTLASLLMQGRPELSITGVDVLLRSDQKIPVLKYDGVKLPFLDRSFDFTMFVDVLHHTNNPLDLLLEAKRVSRLGIIIKDHLREGLLAQTTLRVMDAAGNAHHGVALPYNYLSQIEWQTLFRSAGIRVEHTEAALNLYPFPASLIFERNLHFLSTLNSE